MIVRKLIIFLIGEILIAPTLVFASDKVSCATNDPDASADFTRAIDLLDKGKLESTEEDQVIRLLEASVAKKCKGAAIALSWIKLMQVSAADVDEDRAKKDKLEDQVYKLLSEETDLGDGWFELAMFLSDKNSKYYSLEKTNQYLEKAISLGDIQAINFRKEHPIISK